MRSYLIDRLQKAASVRAAAHAEVLSVISEVEATGEWRRDGASDLGAWVAAACQESVRTAREWVREADALRDRHALRMALESGDISVAQSRALSALCEEGTDDDAAWLESLPFWPINELEREARKQTARVIERRDGGTYLRMTHTDDERYLRGDFQLHPEDGALVLAAIEARIPGGTKLRDWDAASATALVELAKGVAGPNVRATVLLADGDAGELSTGGFVAARTAGRLMCDASVQQVRVDGAGSIVATAPNATPIPSATRRAVEARDAYRCTFPTCERRKYLECHHVVHREHGGTNELSNLQLLCWQHHTLVHEGGWSLGRRAGRRNGWFRPDGTRFEVPRIRVTVDTS